MNEKMNYDALLLKNQLCFPLYAASRKIVRLYASVLENLQLTYTQYITMLVLWEQDGLSVKDLGNQLFLDSGTLTPLLKKLEKSGLISRIRDKQDERNVIIFLTDKGHELKNKAVDVPYKIASCIDIDIKEAVLLKNLLNKIID